MQYDLVQRELREVGALEARVAGEHRSFYARPERVVEEAGGEWIEESANLAAELNLLNSTFAVLGEHD